MAVNGAGVWKTDWEGNLKSLASLFYWCTGRVIPVVYFFLAISIQPVGCAHQGQNVLKEELAQEPASANIHPETNPENISARVEPSPMGPLTLERAVDEALRASTELDQIRKRIDAAEQQVRQVEASFYPRVSFSEEFNATTNPVYALMYIINQRRLQANVIFNQPGQQQNVSSRVQGEWVLFEGGSRWHDRKAAIGQHHSLEAEIRAARNQLVSKVTETYYRWLHSLAFVSVAERALDSARTDERLGEARLRVEMALPSEMARLKAHTAEMHGNLVAVRTGVRRLQAGLERLLARSLGTEEIPDPAQLISPLIAEDVPAEANPLIKQALERRPEVVAVQTLVQVAFQRVQSAKGGFLPRVSTTAQYQWDSEDLGKTAQSWVFGVQATWALFEGGLTLSKVREAQARLGEAKARGEQVALDIALEVRQAVLTIQEAAEKIQVQDERRKWAKKALDEVRHLYRNEVSGVDALLQSEVASNQAEAAYTAAIFEGRIAQALLRQSLGDFVDDIR